MGKKRQFKRPKEERRPNMDGGSLLPSSESLPVKFKQNESEQAKTDAGEADKKSSSRRRSAGDVKADTNQAADPAGETQPDPEDASAKASGDRSAEQASDDRSAEQASAGQSAGQASGAGGPGVRKRKSVSEILEEQASDVERERTRRELLKDAWTVRDRLYNQLFGKPAYVTPKNYGPPSLDVPPDFTEVRDRINPADGFSPGDPSLEEQHLAVLAYGPDPLSPFWKYVTAGLASPWLQYEPQLVSGFGLELMVKSPVDAPWAAQFLRTLAFYVFNHAGTLSPGVRVGLNSSIDPGFSSLLRNAFIWYADEAPDTLYDLPSGGFGMLIAIGMTDDEREFAESIEEYGTWCIQAVLRQAGQGQITDPTRASVMSHPDIDRILSSVRNFADTYRANRSGQISDFE